MPWGGGIISLVLVCLVHCFPLHPLGLFLGVVRVTVSPGVQFSGDWRLPGSPADYCLPLHCASTEPPEEHDGFHTVLQCHGSDLLHCVYVCGQY